LVAQVALHAPGVQPIPGAHVVIAVAGQVPLAQLTAVVTTAGLPLMSQVAA